jgi:hypothetical protein
VQYSLHTRKVAYSEDCSGTPEYSRVLRGL